MRDGFLERPSKPPMKVCDSHSRRTIHSGSAVDIDRVARRKQIIKLRHALRQFAPQFQSVEIRDRHAAKEKPSPLGCCLGTIQSTLSHVVIGLQADDRRDLQRPK